MKRIQQKFKKGVASFYIVAFSTLILVIVSASFATVILSEVTRTANEDLSQSAYDSALAGVEDAKLAFSRYRKCLQDISQSFDGVPCTKIVEWMKNHDDCYMVPKILGKFGPDGTDGVGEVVISDMTTDGGAVTEQAYTCVIMNTVLSDYKSSLSSNNQTRVIKVKMDQNGNANDIEKIRLNWYSTDNDTEPIFSNYRRLEGDDKWRVVFDTLDSSVSSVAAAAPPTLELQIVQTASSFTLDQLMSSSDGNSTDRATLYFVPTDQTVPSGENDTFVSIHNNGTNYVGAGLVANTNNPAVLNKPFLTRCVYDKINEFACSVDIELPAPLGLGGNRNNDTFMLMLGLPYGQPDTDFSLEFICKGTSPCPKVDREGVSESIAFLDMQVLVDSTGRANDLYRRVETRLDLSGSATPYPYYALQLFGDDNDDSSLVKTLYTNGSN